MIKQHIYIYKAGENGKTAEHMQFHNIHNYFILNL